MRNIFIALTVATAMATAMPGYAATMTKESYKSTTKQIDATFKADKEQCKSLKANAKDVCMAEAKAKQKIAKADAEADYKNTDKARADARAGDVLAAQQSEVEAEPFADQKLSAAQKL